MSTTVISGGKINTSIKDIASATYTVTSDDLHIVCTVDCVVTLPAIDYDGRRFIIEGNGGTVTIVADGSNTIEGGLSSIFSGESVVLVGLGTERQAIVSKGSFTASNVVSVSSSIALPSSADIVHIDGSSSAVDISATPGSLIPWKIYRLRAVDVTNEVKLVVVGSVLIGSNAPEGVSEFSFLEQEQINFYSDGSSLYLD